MERALTWLHLSDLHACEARTGWDAHRILDKLMPDLQRMERDHGLRPDLIFFTGDAAFGQLGTEPGLAIADQLQEAHQFLESVRTAFTPCVDRSNVFIVPGNHDVDRTEVTESQTDWLDRQENLDKVLQLIQGKSKEWKRYMDRLGAYRDFLQNNGYDHLLTDPDRLIYALEREIAGTRVGIIGLNSAWSCGPSEKKGKLWVGGKWQIRHLRKQLGKLDLTIGLIHHPGGWFGEYEEPDLTGEIEREFRFHLHGHEHKGWVTAHAEGHTRIAAAACYDRSDRANGYNFVRLDPKKGTGEVWLRRYDPDGGGWIPRAVAGKTDEYGRWPLSNIGSIEPAPSPKKDRPLIVDAMYGGDYVTIMEAVHAADPGDTIEVCPGHYTEQLVIDKPSLKIIGRNEHGPVVVRAKGQSVVVFKTDNGRMANLAIRQMGGERCFGVDIGQGGLHLEGCEITSQGEACVAIHGGADPHLVRNRIHSGKKNGVWVYADGLGTLEENEIFNNDWAQVEIKTGGNPTLRRNRVHGGNTSGIYVHKGGRGTLKENEIFDNDFDGVVIKTRGRPHLCGNCIHHNQRAGVYVSENGKGRLEDNKIFQNTLNGVAIETGGDPTLRGNRIYDNQHSGVYVYENGRGTLVENEISGNCFDGVAIHKGGNPTLRRNHINGNGHAGVSVEDADPDTIEDNDLGSNDWEPWNVPEHLRAKLELANNQE